MQESELLRELDNILTSYISYRSELEKVSEKKTALEKMQNALKLLINKRNCDFFTSEKYARKYVATNQYRN